MYGKGKCFKLPFTTQVYQNTKAARGGGRNADRSLERRKGSPVTYGTGGDLQEPLLRWNEKAKLKYKGR